jgi:MFS family permease
MRRLFIADAMISLAIGFSIPLFVLFFRARGLPSGIINGMVMAYLAAAIVSVPAWTWVARRIGKHRAMMVSAAGYVIVIPTMAIIPPERLDLLFPALGFMGLTFAASTSTPTAPARCMRFWRPPRSWARRWLWASHFGFSDALASTRLTQR